MSAVAAVLVLAGAFTVATRDGATPGPYVAVRLTFPRTVTYPQAVAATRSLAGLLPPWWRRLWNRPSVTLEVRASAAGIEHVLTMPAARREYVIGSLRAAIPGLRVADEASPLPDLALTRYVSPAPGSHGALDLQGVQA